jgi:uncharacterized protein YfaP (DUF2135 family)
MSFRFFLIILVCTALGPLLPSVALGVRIPIYPGHAGAELSSNIEYETFFPINELPAKKWTPAQQKEIYYFLERMKRDDRIFLIIKTVVDPIGSREENEKWALGISQEVGERLLEAGIRPDRILIVPGEEEKSLFNARRWEGFVPLQKVYIRAYQGGDWLRRREVRAAVREELPPEGRTKILEPAEGKTDRANQLLRGVTDPSVRSVAIVLRGETQTAAVYGGRFEVPLSLRPGENRILVTGLDSFGRALRASRVVRYEPPRPTIEITSPAAETIIDISRSPVIEVKGRVLSKIPLRDIYLIQNNTPRNIRFRSDGTFEKRAILITEEDVFSVEAMNQEGTTGVSEPRKVAARGIAERPLLAILHWDEDNVDIDLHVSDASGRHTYFDGPDILQSATAIPDGRLWLDDRNGFGPEAFTIERSTSGIFTFSAEYYRGRKPCRAYLTIVLFAGSPSRKTVHRFGPIEMSPENRNALLVQVSLPEGTILELKK